MTYSFELFLLQNILDNISVFMKYDEDGYPLEDEGDYEESEDVDDDDGFDSDDEINDELD